MQIENDIKLGFSDVMFKPKRSTMSSRADVELFWDFSFVHSPHTLRCIPIIAANMDTVGTFSMAFTLAEHGMLTAVHKHYSIDAWKTFLRKASEYDDKGNSVLDKIMVSTGVLDHDLEKLGNILALSDKLKMICIDVANGYTESFLQTVMKVRERYPNHVIIAGNVVTSEMTEQLVLSGADLVKVGIGPGSVCTTRVKTGVGYPQLSAIIECADAARGLGGAVISDGGCVVPGDVSKAFGAGTHFVMLGSMLAGHTESEAEVLTGDDGERYLLFYGMSSSTAMEKYSGGVSSYRASEGKTVKMKYKGDAHATVLDILGGVRSTCTYVGAKSLRELCKRTTFIRTNEQENRSLNK